MELVAIYECLCDRPRLRILNLLLQANRGCLQDRASEERVFREDSARLAKVRAKFGPDTPAWVHAAAGACTL